MSSPTCNLMGRWHPLGIYVNCLLEINVVEKCFGILANVYLNILFLFFLLFTKDFRNGVE